MPVLWTKDKEIEFFTESSFFATPEQLFYLGYDKRYYAYWPKLYTGRKSTLQSRNSLIVNFTEKFSVDLLQEFAESKIPIIILGNTPITNNYYSKVDHLYHAGIIQGFWSLNPNYPWSGNNETEEV